MTSLISLVSLDSFRHLLKWESQRNVKEKLVNLVCLVGFDKSNPYNFIRV
jgi:hypothetical protein